jgi:hypothetical protein
VTEIPKEIRERFEQWFSEYIRMNAHRLNSKSVYDGQLDIALNAYIEAIRMMCVDATAYEEYQLYCCFDKPK